MNTQLRFTNLLILFTAIFGTSAYSQTCDPTNFTVTAGPTSNCPSDMTITISVPSPVGVTLCTNLTATLTIQGQAFPSNNNGVDANGDLTFSGLSAETWEVRLIDESNNEYGPIVVTTTTNYVPFSNFSFTQTPPVCFGSGAAANSATVTYNGNPDDIKAFVDLDPIVGGNPPYTYTVTDASGTFNPPTDSFFVEPGNVDVSITDACGNNLTQNLEIEGTSGSIPTVRVGWPRSGLVCTNPCGVGIQTLFRNSSLWDYSLDGAPFVIGISPAAYSGYTVPTTPGSHTITWRSSSSPNGCYTYEESFNITVEPRENFDITSTDASTVAYNQSTCMNQVQYLIQPTIDDTLNACDAVSSFTADVYLEDPNTPGMFNFVETIVPQAYGYNFGQAFSVPNTGNYRVEYTQTCGEMITNFVTVEEPDPEDLPPPFEMQLELYTEYNGLEGTSGIRATPINQVYGNQFTTTLERVDGQTLVNFTSTGPFNLAGNYETEFPQTGRRSGNAPTYRYFWTLLPPGEYRVTMVDDNGCFPDVVDTITITNNDVIDYVDEDIIIDQGCPNSTDVAVTLGTKVMGDNNCLRDVIINEDAGGVPGAPRASPQFENLPAGDYWVTGRMARCTLNGTIGSTTTRRVGETSYDPSIEVPFTVAPFAVPGFTTQQFFCTPGNNASGGLLIDVNSGDIEHPITFELYDAADLVTPIMTYTENDDTIFTYTFTPLNIGDYVTRIVTPCASASDPVTITTTTRTFTATASNNQVCASNSASQLGVNAPGAIYNVVWQDDNNVQVGTGNSIIVNPTITTTYTAFITPNNAGCVAPTTQEAMVTVTVTPDPDLTLVVSDIDFCNNLNNPGPYNITISNSQTDFTYEILDENSNPFVPALTGVGNGSDLVISIPVANAPTAGTDYTVTATNGNTVCSGTLTDMVSFISSTPELDLTVTSNSPICQTDNLEITIEASEIDINYEILENGSPLAPAITALGTGGDILLTVPSPITNGAVYSIETSGDVCTTAILTNTIAATVNTNLTQVGTETMTCDTGGTFYSIEIELDGIAPYTATGSGTPGTFVGNTWTSDNIAAGTDYNVNFTDTNNCNTVNVAGTAPVCCVFEVTCPTFPTTTVECYADVDTQTIYTETEFEALGNGDGIIGDIPCGVIEITAANSIDTGNCNQMVTRIYTIREYTDTNNNNTFDTGDIELNIETCIQDIMVDDTIAPTASDPVPITVECLVDVPVADITVVTDAMDNCGNVTVAFVGDVSDGNACAEVITRTYSVTDDCGNSINVAQTITVDDTTSPVIALEAQDLTVECDGAGNTADLNAWLADNGSAISSDACSSVTWSNDFNGLVDDCGVTTSTTVIFTATDECGNVASTTAIFKVEDDTAPEFEGLLPVNELVLECDQTIPPAAILTAVDNCGEANVSFTEIEIEGNCINSYILVRTWIATDACNKTTTHTQTVFIEDTTPPVFTSNLPSDASVTCGAIPDAPILMATDNCDGEATVYFNETEIPGDCSSRYNIERTWVAEDSCGNQTSYTQVLDLACPIEIYNAVSLNDDALNDILLLEGIDCYPNNSVKIFNRWGVLVFETEKYDNVDKVFRGFSEGRITIQQNEQLPTGTYFYILQYEYVGNGVSAKFIEQSGNLYISSRK